MTDPIAERIRKAGGNTLRSIGHIARPQKILDNDADYVEPSDMLGELCDDKKPWFRGYARRIKCLACLADCMN